MNNLDREFLTFLLDGEEYGIDILCVQEIRVWSEVTELPNKPAYIKGVINLRGVIIPIIDLRQRFGKEPLEYNEQTVTIILKTQDKENPMVVGVVVDAVSEVYKFSPKDIRQAPSFGSHIDSCFLQGLASVENKLILLLNSESLLNRDDLYSAEPNNKQTAAEVSNESVEESTDEVLSVE